MSDVTLTVYSTGPDCSPCRAAKKRLDALEIPYVEINVREDEEAAARLRRAGLTMSPVFAWQGHLLTIADLPRILKEAKQ